MEKSSKQYVLEMMYKYITDDWENEYGTFQEFLIDETEYRWCVSHYIYTLLCDYMEEKALDNMMSNVIWEILEGHSIEYHMDYIREKLMTIPNEHYLVRIKNIFDVYDKVIRVRDSAMTNEETRNQLDIILQNTDKVWFELSSEVYDLIIRFRNRRFSI